MTLMDITTTFHDELGEVAGIVAPDGHTLSVSVSIHGPGDWNRCGSIFRGAAGWRAAPPAAARLRQPDGQTAQQAADLLIAWHAEQAEADALEAEVRAEILARRSAASS